MYYQGPSHFSSEVNDLKLYFELYPSSQFAIRHFNERYGKDMYEELIQLERRGLILRSKININDKPVTHWQYNDKYQLNMINERSKPFNTFQRSKSSNESDHQVIKVDKSNEFDCQRVISVVERSKSFGIQKHQNYHNEKIIESIETDSPRNNQTFKKVPLPKLNPISPSKKLNPKSPEFKPQPFNINNENEVGIPNSESISNCSLDFMTAMTKNPVSVLHEFCQQRGMICEFKVIEIEGPPHKPRISTAVFLNGKQFETVVTANKKEGKRKAADLVIRNLISEGLFAAKFSKLSMKSNGTDKISKAKEYSNINKEQFCNSSMMYEHIASLVYNKLSELINQLSPNEGLSFDGKKVVSAIVMHNEKYESFEVVSLATGNRCITGDNLSLQGLIINDSHAEVVARRSLLYFLYKQLDAYLSGTSRSMNLFEEIASQNFLTSKRYFKVKNHIKFHLYISTAPCGDGALFCSKETTIKEKFETHTVLSTDHESLFENNSQGLLRTKIEGGEGTIPVPMSADCNQIQTLDGILHGERLRTMSCSDKIARWNYLGIQGALLEIFMKPIFLKSLILGNLFNAGHLSRAVCCRLEKFQVSPLSGRCGVNHPELVNVYIGELHSEIDKSNELSINWCHGEAIELVDGVTGELSAKTNVNQRSSRLCKASLFYEFLEIYKKLNYSNPIISMTYSEVKSLSRLYDDKKKALYLKFHCAKYGSWVSKPVEQSQFKNNFNI